MHQHLSMHLEVKSLGSREFEGHGAVFGNVDLGGDIVVQGAFAKSLAAHKAAGTMPLMFWMHQADQVPGVWLDMAEDSVGLAVKGEILDTSLGRDVHTLLTKKAVRGLSIGYVPIKSDWRSDGIRLLQEVELREVSIASMQMNPLATVEAAKAARLSSEGEYVPTEREIEKLFRKIGCSRTVALQLVGKLFDDPIAPRGIPGVTLRDSGEIDEEAKQALEAIARLTDSVGGAALQRF